MLPNIPKNVESRCLSEKRASSQELWTAFKPAVLPLCLPIIIIGSIRLGICTPTEAGAVAIAYAVILGIAYKRNPSG